MGAFFIHFHCLAPYRPEWPPVHPDFIQLIYTGQAEAYHPEAREKDGYELEATFRPRADLANLNLSASDLAFLDAALHVQARA